MPELPEVQALAADLRDRATGRVIDRADVAEISVLKTYDPALTALRGQVIGGTERYGKFLGLITGPAAGSGGRLHLIMHLARAGWLRWRDSLPEPPPRPGKGPLAFRLRFADGAGFDLTEAGTRKRLAVYLVTDPAAVPGIASLGPDPLDQAFTPDVLAGILAGRRTQIKGVLRDQGVIAGIGNAYSDEILHAAKMSPFRLAASLSPDEVTQLHAVIVGTLRDADRPLGRAGRRRPEGGEEGRPAGARAGRPAVPGVRRHRARGVVRRLGAAVLPDLPDRRQAAGRPPDVPPAQVGRAGARSVEDLPDPRPAGQVAAALGEG